MTDFTPCPRTVELCAKVAEREIMSWLGKGFLHTKVPQTIRALIKEQDDE